MLLRGELRKYTKKLNFENFDSALYSTSVSMPLSYTRLKIKQFWSGFMVNIVGLYIAFYTELDWQVKSSLGFILTQAKIFHKFVNNPLPINSKLFVYFFLF